MLYNPADRKIIEIFGNRGYHFVGKDCKRCCKTCCRHFCRKENPKHICRVATEDEFTNNMVIGFHRGECVDIPVNPTSVCKKWKSKKTKLK